MFKVVCIEDRSDYTKEHPSVKRGRMYTVVDTRTEKEETVRHKNVLIKYLPGEYYSLAEMGKESWYHHSLFIKIDEDEIDETQFERNYKKELV